MTCPDCGGKLRVYRTYHRSESATRHYCRCDMCQAKHWTETTYGGRIEPGKKVHLSGHQNGNGTHAVMWPDVQRALRRQMTQATYDAVIASTTLVSWRNGQVVIAARNNLAKEWLDNRLYPMVEKTLAQFGDVNQIQFVEE